MNQLFLLHFAGGSAYSFDFLKKHFLSDIEFIPLELPGRGKRHSESLLKVKSKATEDYFNQIKDKRNGAPYIIYGHSMGATLGLSVTQKMEHINDPPRQLIVSGNTGPGIKKSDEIVRHLLNDFEFKEELKRLGGFPVEVQDNKEFFEYFAPIMRADFECLEKYIYSEKGIKLNTPIYALMGSDEKNCDTIENWRNFTTNYFQSKILPGNHFFIHEHAKELARIIQSLFKGYGIKY